MKMKMFSRSGAALSVAIAAFFLVLAPKEAQAQETCPYTLPDSPTDRDRLIAFYCATDGANWTDNTNWLSSMSVRNWYGVIASALGKVYNLDLNNNKLRGSIPDSLGKLTGLTHLYLYNNRLTESIPT